MDLKRILLTALFSSTVLMAMDDPADISASKSVTTDAVMLEMKSTDIDAEKKPRDATSKATTRTPTAAVAAKAPPAVAAKAPPAEKNKFYKSSEIKNVLGRIPALYEALQSGEFVIYDQISSLESDFTPLGTLTYFLTTPTFKSLTIEEKQIYANQLLMILQGYNGDDFSVALLGYNRLLLCGFTGRLQENITSAAMDSLLKAWGSEMEYSNQQSFTTYLLGLNLKAVLETLPAQANGATIYDLAAKETIDGVVEIMESIVFEGSYMNELVGNLHMNVLKSNPDTLANIFMNLFESADYIHSKSMTVFATSYSALMRAFLTDPRFGSTMYHLNRSMLRALTRDELKSNNISIALVLKFYADMKRIFSKGLERHPLFSQMCTTLRVLASQKFKDISEGIFDAPVKNVAEDAQRFLKALTVPQKITKVTSTDSSVGLPTVTETQEEEGDLDESQHPSKRIETGEASTSKPRTSSDAATKDDTTDA